jgi:hypothetical protein
MWGILKSKGTFIRQIMKGDQTQRFAEDVGDITISAAEAEAVASGNPGVIRKLDLEAEIAKLFRLKTAYERRKNEDTQRVSGFLPQKAAGLDREIEAIEKAKEVLGKTSGADFAMKVGGQTFSDRKEAGPALAQAAQAARTTNSSETGPRSSARSRRRRVREAASTTRPHGSPKTRPAWASSFAAR